jgi:hypothetical protein
MRELDKIIKFLFIKFNNLILHKIEDFSTNTYIQSYMDHNPLDESINIINFFYKYIEKNKKIHKLYNRFIEKPNGYSKKNYFKFCIINIIIDIYKNQKILDNGLFINELLYIITNENFNGSQAA